MQEANVTVNYSASERLQKLRIKKQLTWSQIARRLRLSESMLYKALRGDARFSERALFRLLQAEIAAGLRPATDLDKYLEEYNEKRSAPWGFFPQEKEESESQLTAEDKRGLGQRLRWIRQSKRLSVESLAKRCGCDPQFIREIERGEQAKPDENAIKKIATALGVSDGWLLSGIGFMSLEEIDKFKSQRSDFPTLQMISTEDLSSAYKHFEQEISKHSGSLKSIYLEFARRINSELVYRTRTWEHKEK